MSTTAPPDRSLVQRLDALEEANRIRTYRAADKLNLKAGRKDFAAVLNDPDWATGRVFDVLVNLPKIGRAKANRILQRARISPSKTVGGLSPRQRLELTAAVRGATPYATEERAA